MNEVLSKFLQVQEDLQMLFHATRSDADANGNDIIDTYARKDSLKKLEEKSDLQSECIVENADNVEKLNHDVENTNIDLLTVEKRQKSDGDLVSELQAQLDVAKAQIETLTKEIETNVKNKGLFENECSLMEIVPETGDFAVVLAPKTTTDPKTYYGPLYIGKKEDNTENWKGKQDSAYNCVYSASSVLYRVVMDVQYFMLVDTHHTESQLVSDGIIKAVSLTDNAYTYVCETPGEWTRVDRNMSGITVSANTTSDKVKDGDLYQKEINLTQRANNVIANNNLIEIANALDKVIEVVNDLQKNVVIIGEMPYRHITKPYTTGYSVTGDLQDNLLDISPMPIILS